MHGLPAAKDYMLGYPINMNTPPEGFFEWKKQLSEVGLDRFAYNNVGNPKVHSHIPFNTHPMEREVIRHFGNVFHFPPDNAWGFLSHSGTDSNMHGMYYGRTILHGKTGLVPKAYFTKEAHYSMQILRDLLGMEWVEVGTLPDGAMDTADLARCLADNPDHPALVCATTGTTFKGAVDSIDAIGKVLGDRVAYLHVDAALFGGYLPHTEFARELFQTVDGRHRYDSIAVSCHKFFGVASPAGLFVTTQRTFDDFLRLFSGVHDPEYILHVPGTITCSRDGVKPAEFLYHCKEEAVTQRIADTQLILHNARYLYRQLKEHYPHLQPVLANELSNTVYFRKPDDVLVNKYSLATMKLQKEDRQEAYAHIVVMPHATQPVLDHFLEDLAKADRSVA
ncbi:MAG: pyridoxal-dependent decarboxylase [Puniceicoccaceae bacterium]